MCIEKLNAQILTQKLIFFRQMGFVILGFLAMVLFELIVINEMPKSVTEEVAQILDLKPTSCALSSIPENFALPMNFTCNVDGYLVPVV